MALYNEVITELQKENITKELYRFQGGASYNCFIQGENIINKNNSGYIYFSTSLDHHKYFSMKRIKQLLNNDILKNSPYQITKSDIMDSEKFHKIKQLLLKYQKLELTSFQLIYDSYLLSLLKENSYNHETRTPLFSIERVDRKVYGGGYGITEEWTDLLRYMTFFTSYRKISNYDLAELLKRMQQTGKINSKENLNFLFENLTKYHYKINEELINSFTKYDIMNTLETIVEKELCNKNSELFKNPSKTIREILKHYQKGREKTLSLLKDKDITKFLK